MDSYPSRVKNENPLLYKIWRRFMENYLLKKLGEFDDPGKWELDDKSGLAKTVGALVESFRESKMKVLDCAVNPKYPDDIRIHICGGLNGPGRWTDYLEDIRKLFGRLEAEIGHAWMIELNNDCCDDVWYMIIGAEKTK